MIVKPCFRRWQFPALRSLIPSNRDHDRSRSFPCRTAWLLHHLVHCHTFAPSHALRYSPPSKRRFKIHTVWYCPWISATGHCSLIARDMPIDIGQSSKCQSGIQGNAGPKTLFLMHCPAKKLDTPPLNPFNTLPCIQAGGRVAQRESTRFTREGSQVQSLSRPPSILAILETSSRTVCAWLRGPWPRPKAGAVAMAVWT